MITSEASTKIAGATGIAPGLERPRLVGMAAAQHEQRADGERREQQDREPGSSGQLVLRVRQHEQRTPYGLRDDGDPRACGTAGGCGPRAGKNAPSRAIAKYTRGPAIVIALRLPSSTTTTSAAEQLRGGGAEQPVGRDHRDLRLLAAPRSRRSAPRRDRARFRPRYSSTTATVPSARARGTLRPGSRISSATYDAAFQPLYENITMMNASGQLNDASGGRAAQVREAAAPEPEAEGDEQRQGAHLHGGERVLHEAAGPEAADVDQRQRRRSP